jgi:hypothetical protein
MAQYQAFTSKLSKFFVFRMLEDVVGFYNIA